MRILTTLLAILLIAAFISMAGDEEEDTFEKRVDQPEVFEAEYTERGTEEDGSQSNTTRF